MVANWDLFGDEVKLGGTVSAVGLLAIEAGVVPTLTAHLIRDLDRVFNDHRDDTRREVHWVDLDAVEKRIAEQWISTYYRAPMVFFLFIPSAWTRGNRLDLVRAAIQRLEGDPRVPYGLSRSQTTVHLDYDSFDVNELGRLKREFGLLRAFPWDSHGSPLLQLTDVLLGLSNCLYTGELPKNTARGRNKLAVIQTARRQAAAHRRNFLFAYEPQGIRLLLPSPALEFQDGEGPSATPRVASCPLLTSEVPR